ncbi:hypothetical protein BDV11DRAFT_9768 [Aspergillus similis]
MRSFVCFTVFAILFDSLVAAISITEPTANSTYAAGSTITVNWTTVDTDPSYFSLYLWNFVSWPPSYVALATDIPTADESYTVQIPCDTTLNGDTSSARSTEPTSTSSTPRGNALQSAVLSTAVAVSTAFPQTPPAAPRPRSLPSMLRLSPTTTATSSTYTKPGIVPKTIGWCSDYSHPVTLDHPPVPAAAIPTAAPEQVSSVKPVFVTTVTTTIGVPAPAGDARCRAF